MLGFEIISIYNFYKNQVEIIEKKFQKYRLSTTGAYRPLVQKWYRNDLLTTQHDSNQS